MGYEMFDCIFVNHELFARIDTINRTKLLKHNIPEFFSLIIELAALSRFD